MTIVTRPGMTQTLQQARREREAARMRAVAELAERRNGQDESIGRLNKEFQAGRHARGRVDTRAQAREMADRVFGNEEEST